MTTPLTFDSPVSAAFSVDTARRTITGLAVPYGVKAMSRGKWFQFSKGTIQVPAITNRVKLLEAHDFDRARGVAVSLVERDASAEGPAGLYFVAKVAKGAEGDHLLAMAGAPDEDGESTPVWDGVSIGLGQGGRFHLRDGVYHATTTDPAPLAEISITPMPSFTDARVHQVAASATTEGDTMEPEGTTTTTAPEAPDFSEVVRTAIAEGFAALATNPTFPQREVVPTTASTEVTEPAPYRFDGGRAEHSFSADVRDAYMSGDAEARGRLETFLDEAWNAQFAVTTANASALNPTRNRPDLFVPNLDYSRPLWDLVTTGSLDDVTPFTVPKFTSATGLVAAHTQGVEPTPGAFTATAQTITPGPVSGKIEINREVWDQGGSPQADQIIWGEMTRGYFEAIEAKIAATLHASATAELNLASAVDAPLVDALVNYFAGLQFVRGGNRFTAFAADDLLFPALVNAKDSSGRKLLPVLGPTNAQGTVDGAFDRVQLGNVAIRAAWALAALGTTRRSFNFVPSSVYAWASAPKKFTFEYQVKSIDMAIWGYSASAIIRDSDVKPIDYTTAD